MCACRTPLRVCRPLLRDRCAALRFSLALPCACRALPRACLTPPYPQRARVRFHWRRTYYFYIQEAKILKVIVELWQHHGEVRTHLFISYHKHLCWQFWNPFCVCIPIPVPIPTYLVYIFILYACLDYSKIMCQIVPSTYYVDYVHV